MAEGLLVTYAGQKIPDIEIMCPGKVVLQPGFQLPSEEAQDDVHIPLFCSVNPELDTCSLSFTSNTAAAATHQQTSDEQLSIQLD